jgi:GNAT superfamily N-acetyltransferase
VPAEGIVLAKHGEGYVGMSYGDFVPGDPASFVQPFMGTLREYRGRGIATILKQRLIAVAASRGAQRIVTSNDSENAPILAVNRRLGFRPSAARVTLERGE